MWNMFLLDSQIILQEFNRKNFIFGRFNFGFNYLLHLWKYFISAVFHMYMYILEKFSCCSNSEMSLKMVGEMFVDTRYILRIPFLPFLQWTILKYDFYKMRMLHTICLGRSLKYADLKCAFQSCKLFFTWE